MITESKFLTSLDARCLDDGHLWVLLSDLVYQSKLLQTVITVPKGFHTDFASVPRLPIAYWFFGNRAHHESVPHDWIYQTHCFTKKEADRVFLEAMIVRNKSWFIRQPMYRAVYLGGGHAYRYGPNRFANLNSELIKP